MIGLVGLPCGSMLLNPIIEPSGLIGLSGRMALGSSQGMLRDDRAQGHDGIFQGRDPHRVLPTQLRRIGWDDDIVPGNPIEHLHIVQVEVDRVRVHTVVGDAPDLRAIDGRRWA